MRFGHTVCGENRLTLLDKAGCLFHLIYFPTHSSGRAYTISAGMRVAVRVGFSIFYLILLLLTALHAVCLLHLHPQIGDPGVPVLFMSLRSTP